MQCQHQTQAIVSLSYSKVSEGCFGKKFKKKSRDRLGSYSLKLSKRNCPTLDCLTHFKATNVQKGGSKIPNDKRIHDELVQR